MAYIEKQNYTEFKRYCKSMELRNDPQLIEAYKQAHAKGSVWPEIGEGLRRIGVLDMEIYLVGTRLFMIMDTVPDFDHDSAFARLATMPRQSEWETHMSRFQDTLAEASADEKWQLIERIYKMDKTSGSL
ncbi:MAG: L-rhamnose mutarotase [Breznakibacter sp.]